MEKGRKGTHPYRMQEGFSLVEVIIAVAVLAILTLPILNYFTQSSVFTSRGKNTQRANLAGEAVMEDLNAIKSFEELESTPVPPTVSGTSISPGWSVSVDDVNHKADVEQDITLDGFDYHVIATVDYNYADKDGNGKDSFNAYKIPELKEVYSPANAVFEETDQSEIALSDFYYENQLESKAAILDGMKRSLCIDVEPSTDNGREIYWLHSYYKFFYGGGKKEYTIRDHKIEKDKLKNIYVFYKVLNDVIQNEPVEVRFLNFADSDEIKNFNLYFLLQDTPATNVNPSLRKPNGYSVAINSTSAGADNPEPIDITMAGVYENAHYFTNGISNASSIINFDSSVVAREEGKRIAHITVDVYEYRSGSTYPESERLVRLESSKSSGGN